MTMSDFANQKCVPCEGGIAPLTKTDAQETMKHVPDWTLDEEGKHIQRTFLFVGFKEAMVFVNRVAEIAEHEGHHPDIDIHWNKVTLNLWTHAIGGLSTNDFIVAAKIDTLI
jgi:4a-hydroxytetrahydrobiopterin dehydratase